MFDEMREIVFRPGEISLSPSDCNKITKKYNLQDLDVRILTCIISFLFWWDEWREFGADDLKAAPPNHGLAWYTAQAFRDAILQSSESSIASLVDPTLCLSTLSIKGILENSEQTGLFRMSPEMIDFMAELTDEHS